VRAALLDVKGVKRATVTLENNEAVVTYDPAKVKIDDLLRSVAHAQGPTDQVYTAKVKKKGPVPHRRGVANSDGSALSMT
jgi:copper chaperone CopZ